MAAKITHVRWLKNRGLTIAYRYESGARGWRYEPPGGKLTLLEAAQVLKVAPLKLYRLRARHALETVKVHGITMLPLRELRRLHNA